MTIPTGITDNPNIYGAASPSPLASRKLLQPFDLSRDDVVHTIRILQASMHGFIQAEQAGLFVFSQSVDESYERMINTLLDGLVQQQMKHHRVSNRKSKA